MGDPEFPSDLRQLLFMVPRSFTTLIFVDSRSCKRCEMWWTRPHAQMYRIPNKKNYTRRNGLTLLFLPSLFRYFP